MVGTFSRYIWISGYRLAYSPLCTKYGMSFAARMLRAIVFFLMIRRPPRSTLFPYTPPLSDYFRGNLWPNTPDILHETLVRGGRPAFKFRLVMAATLSSLYGIYSGYELCEN